MSKSEPTHAVEGPYVPFAPRRERTRSCKTSWKATALASQACALVIYFPSQLPRMIIPGTELTALLPPAQAAPKENANGKSGRHRRLVLPSS